MAHNGFCQAMRQFQQLGHVPIFLVSESSAGVVYEKGAGVSGYVRKAVLLDHVMLLLGAASANIGSATDAPTRPAA